MRRFSPALCGCLLLGFLCLSAPAQEPKPPATSSTPSLPVGVIVPRPLLPLQNPAGTAAPTPSSVIDISANLLNVAA